jgi:LytS/YehU family sensor histidine kinase
MTLLGAWSALYYAINYYLQVEQQADRLERLEAQATSAQLAMLRYQLNPHFLFNTLNSISTLVLLKQTERANAMLARLSSFLRYTLANEPTANVTLAQEVETLKLYHEIEKMRI